VRKGDHHCGGATSFILILVDRNIACPIHSNKELYTAFLHSASISNPKLEAELLYHAGTSLLEMVQVGTFESAIVDQGNNIIGHNDNR